ncbi:hypothetical protein [Pararhizobium sp. O133]|uniref:hypothetical protein n=1 Tax=Pararhizobium sp. O133 TaxID=3449278 RepID=UPI003F682FD7
MSVNRLAMTAPALCAEHAVLMSAEISSESTVIVDLGSDWTTDKAWSAARNFLDRPGALALALLRIDRPDDDAELAAIARLTALRPSGFVLSGCRGTADIQMLDVMLRVAEAEHGLDAGLIAIIAEVGEEPEFFLSPNSLQSKSQRLQGLLFNTQALTRATASAAVNAAAGRMGAPLLFARASAVLKARQAGIPCHEIVEVSLSGKDLRIRQEVSLADGFTGLVVRTPEQLAALSG